MISFSIRVQNLSKHYGSNQVFDDISFTHESGILGIAGPNGSGKSTLLKCLAELRRPSSGTVKWLMDEQELDPGLLKKHLGYAAPYINLYAELSCAENIDFLLKLRGISKRDAAVKAALQKTEILALTDLPFGNLSTGQQQRLRLASALVHQPKILFLDEPGSNLDEKGRLLIEKLVNDFRKSQKLVFIASNNPDELDLCDRVYSVEEETFSLVKEK